jgi:DNA polymerase III delta subunit
MQGKVPDHDHDLSRWTQARASRLGKRMSLEVAHALTEHTGNDLGKIAGSLDALALFVGDRPEIDAAALAEVVGGTGEQTMFRICDEVLEGSARKALHTLETTFRAGLEMQGKSVRKAEGIALIVLGQLSRRLLALYAARRAFERRVSPDEVMSRFGPTQTGFKARFAREVARFDAETLRRSISRLRELEVALKSGGADAGADLLLETFVVDLCRRPAPKGGFPWSDRRGGGRRWG